MSSPSVTHELLLGPSQHPSQSCLLVLPRSQCVLSPGAVQMSVATLTTQLQTFPAGTIPPGRGTTVMRSFHALHQMVLLEVIALALPALAAVMSRLLMLPSPLCPRW